jgi:hypothetical protein
MRSILEWDSRDHKTSGVFNAFKTWRTKDSLCNWESFHVRNLLNLPSLTLSPSLKKLEAHSCISYLIGIMLKKV